MYEAAPLHHKDHLLSVLEVGWKDPNACWDVRGTGQ